MQLSILPFQLPSGATGPPHFPPNRYPQPFLATILVLGVNLVALRFEQEQ